jgi:hypothetical protein
MKLTIRSSRWISVDRWRYRSVLTSARCGHSSSSRVRRRPDPGPLQQPYLRSPCLRISRLEKFAGAPIYGSMYDDVSFASAEDLRFAMLRF